MGNILAFDFGLKRIGVAVGQTVTQSASPLKILPAKEGKPDWQQVAQLIDEWQPDCLVVGIPLTMTGDDTHATEPAKRFGGRLYGRFHLPVYGVDERLTSRAAHDSLEEKPWLNRKHHQAIDDLAAKSILDTWMSQAGEPKCLMSWKN